MKTTLLKSIVCATALFGSTLSISSQDNAQSVIPMLSTQWAEINYQKPVEVQAGLFSNLSKLAKAELKNTPSDPALLSWAGIIAASHAGSRGGLGALKVAKKARGYFEEAMRIDTEALQGGARTSLGVLYYKVPGWPIGFGNSEKAEMLLTESAKKYPESLNAQFFYADFLMQQKRFVEAHQVFERAALIAPRIDYQIADKGRLEEVQSRLSRLGKILS